ncbi:MAG TPA: PIG-L deacetylase family protein [Thermoanaerobaculia bacterium]|nr:PIG-L deacetylase family protein [Thermoanaerobaculia bacterium]
MDLPFERTLVLAPHPDDESIGAGGLLAHIAHSGGDVRVVFLTNGDNNPWPQRAYRRRWRIDARDRVAWGRLRRREARRALRILGISANHAAFLDLPDDGLATVLRRDRDRLVGPVAKIVAEFRPTLLIVPSLDDFHADHRATHRAALRALFPHDMPKPLVLGYVVHGKHRGATRRIEVCPADREKKRGAIGCHLTQLVLSRKRFLEYAARQEEFAAIQIVTVRDESRLARWRAKCRHIASVVR